MKKETLFNTAVYIRLSKEDGDKAESDSITNQRKLIYDFLKSRGEFLIYDTYVDDGYTGTNFERPSFQRMVSDIENKNINCVVVKDLSRFGRDYIRTGEYLERYFPDNDVRFIAITDNIDSFRQSYDMLLPIKNIFNEQYARDISGKIHAAMTAKQKNGEFIGAFACYGYKKSPADKNKLVVDEYAAGIVRKIFSLYIAGYGKARIAKMLNEEKIVCPSEYKRLNGDNYYNSHRLESTVYWTYSTVNRLLQNEMYCGNMVQGRKVQHMRKKAKAREREDWIVVEGTHEAIINRETWDKAQGLLGRRTRELDLNSNMTIFAGFLKCGDCGRSLVKKEWKPKQGKGTVNYYCGGYVRSGRNFCTPHGIPHSVLEKVILGDLKTITGSIENIREIAGRQEKEEKPLKRRNEKEKKRLENELQKAGHLKKSVYEDFRCGLLSREEYLSYREDYAKREETLKKQLEELESRDSMSVSSILDSPWVKRLLEVGEVEKLDRDIIVEMVHSIQVYENHRLKITYNFSDELEHLFNTVYETKAVTG